MMTDSYDYRGRFEVEDRHSRDGFPCRYFIRLTHPDRRIFSIGVELPVDLYQDLLDRHDGRQLESRVNIVVGNSLSMVEVDVLVPHKEVRNALRSMPEHHQYDCEFVVEENKDRRHYIRLKANGNRAIPVGVEVSREIYNEIIRRHEGGPLIAKSSVVVSGSTSRLELEVLVHRRELKKP